MDINGIVALSIIASGIYSFLCFFPNPGKLLFPNLHTEGASVTQKYSIFFTGIFCVAVGLYSFFINPLIN